MSRRSELRRITLVALVISGAIAACSLTRPSVDECSSSLDCREAFGVGTTCGSDGLCEKAEPLARCNETFPEDLLTRPESYPNAIVFGNLMDRSVSTQAERENAVRLAVEQVAAEGGFEGRPFGVVFCDIAEDKQYDSLARTAAAIASARYLVDMIGVPAIIGPSASPDAIAVFDAVKNDGVLVMSPAATSTELTSADITAVASDEKPGLLWRTAPPDSIQGLAIAKYLKQLATPPDHVVVIHETGAYGEALSGVFSSTYATAGETVELFPFANANERDALIVDSATSAADAVLFVSSQTNDAAGFLLAAANEPGYATKSLLLTDSAANADFLAQAAGASALFPRVTGTRPGLGGAYDLFNASFNAEFQVDADDYSFVAHAYDAAWLLFYGSVWATTQDAGLSGIGIARGIRRIAGGPTQFLVRPLDWKPITDALRAGETVDVEGASGTLDFDPVNEETASAIEIWSISADGKTIVVDETIE